MKNNSKNITKKDISKLIYSRFGTSEKIIASFVDDMFDILKEVILEKKRLNITIIFCWLFN